MTIPRQINLRKRGMVVQPRSNEKILNLALETRRKLDCEDVFYFPIGPLLDRHLEKLLLGAYYEVRSEKEMDLDEGRVLVGEKILILREDVHIKLHEKNEPRARFTGAHELGHLLMHRETEPHFTRNCSPDVPFYKDSEWQADSFAGNLLFPPHIAKQISNVEEAVSRCGISRSAYQRAMTKYRELRWVS